MKYLRKFNEGKDDMWSYQIIIKADTNDGDYVTQITKWDENKFISNIPILRKICKVLNSVRKGSARWETGEMKGDGSPEKLYLNTGLLTQEEIDFLENLTPSGEYGIHTIESIRVVEIVSDEELL